jgi:hypothetical protein
MTEHEQETSEVLQAPASSHIREAMLAVVRRSDWMQHASVGTTNQSERKEGQLARETGLPHLKDS